MKEKQLITLAVLGTIFLITVIWWFRNQRGTLRRGSIPYKGPTRSSRASDLKILTPQEERIAQQAARLAEKGQVKQAAHMYEQVGLHRDAITILETAGLIDDAARVLLRIQKPARAAVIYSRNNHWKEAAQCFLQAGQPLDAANCLRECGQLKEAGEIYNKEGQIDLAAECFEASHNYLDAARIWMKAPRPQKTTECLVKFAMASEPHNIPNLTHDEFDLLFEFVKTKKPIPQISGLLARSPKITKMIFDALVGNNFELALTLVKNSPDHLAGTLMSEVNVQSPEAISLAALFGSAGQDRYAAMLFEQVGDFKSAAESFEKAGDTDRASYCLERLGLGKPRGSVKTPPPPATYAESKPEAPRGNFFIETGEIKLEDSAAQIKTIPFPAQQPEGTSDGDILSDVELRLLRRDWLFSGCSEDDLDLLMGLFTAVSLAPGSSILSGSRETFLIMVSNGDLKSESGTVSAGDWLRPELALSGAPAVTWLTESPSRVLIIRALDFDHLLRQNADLTRHLYTNLTAYLINLAHNPLKDLAV